jgi:hypothetical protein
MMRRFALRAILGGSAVLCMSPKSYARSSPATAKQPLFTFGVIADVQWADSEDGFSYDRSVARRYRGAFRTLVRAVDWWRELPTPPSFIAQLGDIIDGINETGIPALYGSAPEDLRDHNPALVFERMWDESQGMLDNARRIHARARRLQQEGAYRTLEQKGFRRRAGQAIWSRAVHRVGNLRGAFVDGHPTKEVLATGGEEAAAAAPALNHRARELMLRYATRISDVISDTDDDVVSAQKVYAELVREAGSRRNLQNVLREAGVSAMAPVAAFVRVFPDFFRLEGNRVRFIGD